MGCYVWSAGVDVDQHLISVKEGPALAGEHLCALSNVNKTRLTAAFLNAFNFRTIALLCQCFYSVSQEKVAP